MIRSSGRVPLLRLQTDPCPRMAVVGREAMATLGDGVGVGVAKLSFVVFVFLTRNTTCVLLAHYRVCVWTASD